MPEILTWRRLIVAVHAAQYLLRGFLRRPHEPSQGIVQGGSPGYTESGPLVVRGKESCSLDRPHCLTSTCDDPQLPVQSAWLSPANPSLQQPRTLGAFTAIP